MASHICGYIIMLANIRLASTYPDPGDTIVMCERNVQIANASSYGYIQSMNYPEQAPDTNGTCNVTLVLDYPALVQIHVDGEYNLTQDGQSKNDIFNSSILYVDRQKRFDVVGSGPLPNNSFLGSITFHLHNKQNLIFKFINSNHIGDKSAVFRIRYTVLRPMLYWSGNRRDSYPVETEGIIISHLGIQRNNYNSNLNSSLALTGITLGSEIRIEPSWIDLQNAERCGDYLEITGGDPTITICGNSSLEHRIVTAINSNLTFRFITDRRREGRGFRIKYLLLPQGQIAATDSTSLRSSLTETTAKTTISTFSTQSPTTARYTTTSADNQQEATDKNKLLIGIGIGGGIIGAVAFVAFITLMSCKARQKKRDIEKKSAITNGVVASTNDDRITLLARVLQGANPTPNQRQVETAAAVQPPIELPALEEARHNPRHSNHVEQPVCLQPPVDERNSETHPYENICDNNGGVSPQQADDAEYENTAAAPPDGYESFVRPGDWSAEDQYTSIRCNSQP